MIPPREKLRTVYDAVIEEIDSTRGSRQLTNAFYSKIGDAIFEACYSALEDSQTAHEKHMVPPRLRVVPAPMGSGKTSFSQAFIAALVRLAAHNRELACGGVFVVKERQAADNLYRSLNALLPGCVAIWTTDHNARSTKPPETVQEPAARYNIDDLENFPVAIVTHAFYKGKNGHKAQNYVCDGGTRPRVLTIIDEQPDDVDIFDVTPGEAVAVWEAMQSDERQSTFISPMLQPLVAFLTSKALGGSSLEKPSDDPSAWETATAGLEWFTTQAARGYAKANKDRIPNIVKVFGLAAAAYKVCAFITRYESEVPRFVGYENNIALRPGMLLMDATADIDGVTQLCPASRLHMEIPQPSFANLEIVHVTSPYVGKNLSKVLTTDKARLEYVDWMKAVILQHVKPGQRALVVCKKSLFDHRNVPDWDRRDKRFETPDLYTKHYGWELEDRKLCAIHWGTGIGENSWQDADVVLLFGEFDKPRRSSIALAQGLTSSKATEGALSSMTAINSKSTKVNIIREGDLLRWTRQMALRGKGRHFDEHGVCGHQKLVCTGDYERLLANAPRLFPGAPPITKVGDTGNTYAQKLLEVLSRPDLPDIITTKWIGEEVGAPWRFWGKDVLKRAETQGCLRALGLRYEPARGPSGGRFVRDTTTQISELISTALQRSRGSQEENSRVD